MNHTFWKNKKVLISGHEGFLGSNLAKTLAGCGAAVTGVDIVSRRPLSMLSGICGHIDCIKGDISDFAFINGVIKKTRPSIVFHLAAEAIVSRAKRDPRRAFSSNVEGTWNILEAIRTSKGVKAVIVASSDKAYGPSKTLPYTESTPLLGCHPYDSSKSCADIIAQAYYRSYKVPVCIMRCGNIYGPGDFNFSRLIPDAIKCGLKRERFVIRSDGKYIRDYIYVDDVVEGYILLAELMNKKKLLGEAFNLSNNKPYSVIKIYGKIEKAFKEKLEKPSILNKAQDEIRAQYLSSEKAKKILRWKPRYSIDEGLKKTIEWYRDNADKF